MQLNIIVMVQKPYDLLNAIEYAHKCGLSEADVTAMIVGRHVNANAAAELCGQRGVAVLRVPEPDLYATCVSYLNATRKFRGKALLAVKAALLPVAYVAWLYAYLRGRFLLRKLSCRTLIFDAWRAKCLYMACIDADEHVLVDGGYSTLHYGLCEAFSRGGSRELVRTALSKQKPRGPWVLRALFVRKTKPMAKFFTCYEGRIDPACAYPHETNRYEWSASTLRRKAADERVLILGIPLLKHIDTYLAAALDLLRSKGRDATPDAIEYRFHPTDRNRSGLDASYKELIERGATERGVHWSYPSYSLEFDFLNGKNVPAAIVCYETSSVAWIRNVMGPSVELKLLPDR